MEPPAFASLAHVQILLLPVGSIRRSTFDRWASELRSIESIPLGDIPAESKDERARFMPSPLASGHIHLSYQSHAPAAAHNPLALFRPSEFPLGVVGIASCSHSDSISTTLASFKSTVKDLSLHKATFPVSQNCFVFEENDANLDLGDKFPGLVVIPSMMANKRVHISTLLAGLCSQILGDFATVMQSLESPLGNEYLNASLFPSFPSASDLPRSLDPETAHRDSLPPLPSFNSQPDLGTTNGSAKHKTPAALKRMSSGPGLVPSRTASLPSTPVTAKKRPNIIGTASSHGRLFKVLADLFLMAGRHADSQIWYTEAIALFKGSPHDTAWHAAALEGLATIPVIEAWSSGSATANGTDEKEPWQDIVDKLTQATSLYHKSTPHSEPERALPLLAYLYSRSVIRHTSLLFAIWSAKGWGPHAFGKMVHPGANPYLSSSTALSNTDHNGVTVTVVNGRTRASYAELERLATITGITRTQIAGILSQVHGPWLLHVPARERIGVLQTVAGMFGALGYLRKEAYILRELLGSIMDLIVCGRGESSGARASGVGLGIQGAPMSKASTTSGTVGVRENPRVEGNESVLRIIKHICRVHGVDIESVKLVDIGALAAESNGDAADDAEEEDSTEPPQDPFGWPELQIGIIREAIAVAEALPDYPSDTTPVMSQSDQIHLYHTATRALTTAIRRGDRRTVEYWAGKPIVSIEMLPLPLIRLPIEKPLSLLARAGDQPGVNTILTGAKDPFLYNPRKVAPGQTQSVLVQNERFEVVMTLRNPFVFDLQLESLALSTYGVRIESEAMPITIPANTYHPVTMTGKAVEPGTLTIRGCVVQAPGGLPREYVLPLSTEEAEETRSRRRSAIESEVGRAKYAGLESLPWKRMSKRDSKQASKTASLWFLECKVVPEQPLLRIRRTSLTHAAVMLYNGETSTIRLTLENVSSLPIDLIRLTFDDSTIAPGQQALAEGELSVFETYETEYDLIHRPVFSWDNERDTSRVDPGEKTTVSVKCFGKVGCTSGAVHLSYAYIHRHQEMLEEKPPDVFHTRQLSYPVVVTVYHMLECHAMDISPYSRVTAFAARRALFDVDDVADWCLFSVDVRNTYGSPFEVTFERKEPGEWTHIQKAGTIVLPVRKILLSEEQTSRPIPTLSDRQFVVVKSNLSSAEEKAQRELFWYREELFKTVQGRWRETGGLRSGELSLRQQRMTHPMLKALCTETARVQMSLIRYDGEAATPIAVDPSGSKYLPPPNEFVYLRTKVTNLSPAELVLVANLSLEPAQHTIYQGVLTDIPMGRLAPGESYETELPVAFLSRGRFDVLTEIRALNVSDSSSPIGRGDLRAVVETDFS
ncbi:TRAPP II complex [Fomitopsis serialis]|uniref:TRAPP II complex n=1 Tax=Fomitopsis serialis TaxID=139415 RepID=UPI002008504C|nr:TRAPP II complex [Neoantrodia serialis]KAH9926207.1 TRAPP II complex [Neoantrodia serialis]